MPGSSNSFVAECAFARVSTRNPPTTSHETRAWVSKYDILSIDNSSSDVRGPRLVGHCMRIYIEPHITNKTTNIGALNE